MKITVETEVLAPVEAAWRTWTAPEDIRPWIAASDDWARPAATVELRGGGDCRSRMEAGDGSTGFDLDGPCLRVVAPVLGDSSFGGRALRVDFIADGATTLVRETFDAETENPVDMQRAGWQAILDNFKRHVEGGNRGRAR